MSTSGQGDTPHQILDVAQNSARSGDSTRWVTRASAGPGIRNVSLHSHLPGKADFGVALVRRYRQRLERDLEAVSPATDSAPERLDRCLTARRTVVHEGGLICLCAVLAGDYNTLPEEMRREVRARLDLDEGWLAGGRSRGRWTFTAGAGGPFSGCPRHLAPKKSWHGDQDLNGEKDRYSISHRYRTSSSAATTYRMGLTCRPRPLSSLIAA